MLVVGLLCGIAASVLFNVGIALQAFEARSAPAEEGLRVSLLTDLLRRPRWVAGLLLGALGVPLEIVAFAGAPFVVVEPILACGLLVLLAAGTRLLGERLSAGVFLGVFAIIAGTALIAWGAPPHNEQHRGAAAVIAVMVLLVLASLVPFVLRGTRWDNALVPNLGSACGFAATNVAAKLMADDIGGGHYPEAVGWLLVAAFAGVAATVSGMTALQRRPATTVVPISTAVQTFLPVALEPLFLTESWRAAGFGGGVLLAGILVLLLGTVVVARTRSVSTLAGAD